MITPLTPSALEKLERLLKAATQHDCFLTTQLISHDAPRGGKALISIQISPHDLAALRESARAYQRLTSALEFLHGQSHEMFVVPAGAILETASDLGWEG